MTPFEELLKIMQALRKGCPWDREQTHKEGVLKSSYALDRL